MSVSRRSISLRELRDDELRAAFDVVQQLRDHLDVDEFIRRLARQKRSGYMLFGAFEGSGQLVGVLGMRPVATLARGEHLHVDDLVVDRARRGSGVGQELMAFAEAWARDHGCGVVFLDSRPDVVAFYSELGYEPHTATLMRKRLAAPIARGGIE